MALEQQTVDKSSQPVWLDFTDAQLRASWRGYDLASDSLMIYFGGKSIPAYNYLVDCDQVGVMYLRLDIYSNEVLGLEVEYFLQIVVPSRPELFSLMDGARLHGLSPDELGEIRMLLGINDPPSREKATYEQVLKSLLDDIQANRSPLARKVRADQAIFDKVTQAIWA